MRKGELIGHTWNDIEKGDMQCVTGSLGVAMGREEREVKGINS